MFRTLLIRNFISFLLQIDSSQIWGFHEIFSVFYFAQYWFKNLILLNGPSWILFSSSSGLGSVCAILIIWSEFKHLLPFPWFDLNFDFRISIFIITSSKHKISWNLEQEVLLESNDSLAKFVNQILRLRNQLKSTIYPYLSGIRTYTNSDILFSKL